MNTEQAIQTLQANAQLLHFEHPHLGLDEAIGVVIEALSHYNEHFSLCEDGVLLSEESGRELDRYDYESIARHFYELGMSVMRERIRNPDYNQKVIEKMKSEYPMDESNTRKEK